MVSLSDGQTIVETKLINNGNKLSPWLQLLNYLRKNKDKKILSIQVVINGKIYNTPRLQHKTNAKFVDSDKPDRLWCSKKASQIFVGGWTYSSSYGLSYRFGDYRHYLWIDEKTNETHTEIVPIKGHREEVIEKFYDEVVGNECDISTI